MKKQTSSLLQTRQGAGKITPASDWDIGNHNDAPRSVPSNPDYLSDSWEKNFKIHMCVCVCNLLIACYRKKPLTERACRSPLPPGQTLEMFGSNRLINDSDMPRPRWNILLAQDYQSQVTKAAQGCNHSCNIGQKAEKVYLDKDTKPSVNATGW